MKRRIMGLLPQVACMAAYAGAGWGTGWVIGTSSPRAIASAAFLGTIALAMIAGAILRDQGRGR